jgi:hypothetical protein
MAFDPNYVPGGSSPGEGLTSARSAREKEQEQNWYKKLNKDQYDILYKQMQYPFDAKFIWSSFLSLDPDEQLNASDNIKSNAMSFKSLYDPLPTPRSGFIQPTTYAEWAEKYPYAEFCPPGWSYNRQRFLGELPVSYRSRDRDLELGGSRRSLQKSRLVKRKSRKYKSIKKSKKRSFRKRSGKY